MKIVVVAEYYPRADDPVLGIWAHRQAVAAAQAGADVRVIVLHRPVPPKAVLTQPTLQGLLSPLRQPRRAVLDGIPVRYLHYVAPPRWRSYASWGAWAAPVLRRELSGLRRTFRFDLVHAHYAAPAGDAVRRALPRAPLVVSVHGGDVLSVAERSPAGRLAVTRAFEHARLVMANSAGTERRCRALGARRTEVVRLGTDLPASRARQRRSDPPRIVTVGHLVARKRHADVARAVWLLRDAVPDLRWTVVGDGPERPALEALAQRLGIADRVELTGRLAHEEAVRVARTATAFVLPSVDEAFGVAYVEAMAGGVPAIGARGEDGPEEIARAGRGGIVLVPPGDPEALAREIRQLAEDREYREELGDLARETVEAAFTWERCGRETVAAYEAALAAVPASR